MLALHFSGKTERLVSLTKLSPMQTSDKLSKLSSVSRQLYILPSAAVRFFWPTKLWKSYSISLTSLKSPVQTAFVMENLHCDHIISSIDHQSMDVWNFVQIIRCCTCTMCKTFFLVHIKCQIENTKALNFFGGGGRTRCEVLYSTHSTIPDETPLPRK